jgi:hypothetical protein
VGGCCSGRRLADIQHQKKLGKTSSTWDGRQAKEKTALLARENKRENNIGPARKQKEIK